jgi:hypothetical protein
LLLSWGADEKKQEAVSDVSADDIPSREPNGPEPKSNRDDEGSGVGETWKKPRSVSILVMLAICILAMVLLLWHGVSPKPVRTIWN